MTLSRIFTCLVLLSAHASLSYAEAGSPQPPSLENPNTVRVTPELYALIGAMDVPNARNGGFICNSAFVITSDGVVVIDPGGSRQVGEMLIREIRKVTDKPVTHVFNTHHHADHWMGNHAFAELKPRPQIIGHEVMINTAAEIGERWLGIIRDMTEGANQGTQVVLPEQSVKGDTVMNIGGTRFELIHPPHAHTKGDIAIYLPAQRSLIAGDILFHQRTPGFQDASPLGNAKALQGMLQYDLAHVIPGHGPLTDKQGIQHMLDFINLLHAEVKKYFAQGMEDFEMKDKLEMGGFRELSGFDGRFGVTVNRMYMEVEAEAFH